jgi:hypothetical protein
MGKSLRKRKNHKRKDRKTLRTKMSKKCKGGDQNKPGDLHLWRTIKEGLFGISQEQHYKAKIEDLEYKLNTSVNKLRRILNAKLGTKYPHTISQIFDKEVLGPNLQEYKNIHKEKVDEILEFDKKLDNEIQNCENKETNQDKINCLKDIIKNINERYMTINIIYDEIATELGFPNYNIFQVEST